MGFGYPEACLVLRGRPPREPWRRADLADLAAKPAYAEVIRHATVSSDITASVAEDGFADGLAGLIDRFRGDGDGGR